MTTRRDLLKKIGAGLAVATLPGWSHAATGGQAGREVHLFSKHLQWLDYEAMADTAARIGFDGIDLTVRPGGHVLPGNAERDLPRAVAATRNAGLKVNRVTTAITDPEDPLTLSVLDTASQLGIEIYRMGWLKYDRDRPIPGQLEAYKRQLEKLAALNERLGIQGAYQNHSGTGVGSPVWDAWLLVRDLDPRWLGIRYDVRHAMAEGTKSWELGLQLLAPYIHSLDIKDFHWYKNEDRWDVESVPLGEGAVDFPRYFGLLEKWDISADMTLHLEYPLGGADKGKSEIDIPAEAVISAMEKDLEVLQKWA